MTTERKRGHDGINGGVEAAGKGIGRFFTAMIPWALGIGVAVWLGVYAALTAYRHDQQTQQRLAEYVGAAQRPRSKITVNPKPHDCTTITAVAVDGWTVTVYARNDCHQRLDYMEWHANELSPDGTVVHHSYENTATCPAANEPGSVAECRIAITEDDRVAWLDVWTTKR